MPFIKNQQLTWITDRRLGVLVLLPLLLLLMAANDYRFTYTNPSIGDPRAPFVLEYFSLVDCVPCRQFESDGFRELLQLVDDGQLRIIFRDLPPSESMVGAGNWQFCLQEYPDYLAKRLASKRTRDVEQLSLPPLTGKQGARYSSCLATRPSIPVLSHNQTVFEDHGFVGTPSFVFFDNHGRESAVQRWSGPITASDLQNAMSSSFTRRP